MTAIKYHTAQFYESLANLFYAMAMADTRIAKQEKLRIKELVEKHWSVLSPELDSSQTIYNTLKKLIRKHETKEEAFSRFKTFFLNNRELYTEEIRDKLIDNADRIALAFSGRNKSESILLYQLYKVLHEPF